MHRGKDRCELIDAAKGLGILCVYLGHLVVYGSPIFRIIFNFHMPLFFFLSGCFFRPEENGRARNYFQRMLVNIGIPFVFFTVVSACVSIFFPPEAIPHKDTYPYWLIYCVLTLHSGPVFVTNVWFLLCLAVTQAIAWIVWPWCRRSDRRLVVLVVACIGLAYGISMLDFHVKHLFPLMTSSVPMALVFFLLGHIMFQKINVLSKQRICAKMLFVMLMVWAIEIVFAVFLCSESPNLAVPEFPSWWVFPIASATGIFGVLLLGKELNFRWLRFLGTYSLYLFLFEAYGTGIARFILDKFGLALNKNPLAFALPWRNILLLLILSLVVASGLALLAKTILRPIQMRIRGLFEEIGDDNRK